MRKFHTYVNTPKGLSRGLNNLKKNVLQNTDLEKLINQFIRSQGFCRILEIGTGKGLTLLELCSKIEGLECIGINKSRLHGADGKKELLKTAIEAGFKLKSTPEIVITNATKLPFNDLYFDIVLSQVTFMHIKNKLKAISEISRVMTIGGCAFLHIDGWELKSHKPKGKMPKIYETLFKKLKFDATPRIFLYKEGTYVTLKSQMQNIPMFKVNFKTNKEIIKSQMNSNFKQIIHIKKIGPGKIDLPFLRNAKKSKELTNLSITNHNPASYGSIDYYIFKRH